MILPIVLYGNPILRQRAPRVPEDSPELQRLIDDMIETMRGASGIGLAAPQVGRTERVFVVDLTPMAQELEEELGSIPAYARGPMVFINPVLQELPGDSSSLEEGCLSIPDVREQVNRPASIRIEYLDREFQARSLEADGYLARVLQHEYDHLEGVLFLDYLTPLRRRLLQRRLKAIARGEVEADYPLTTEAA